MITSKHETSQPTGSFRDPETDQGPGFVKIAWTIHATNSNGKRSGCGWIRTTGNGGTTGNGRTTGNGATRGTGANHATRGTGGERLNRLKFHLIGALAALLVFSSVCGQYDWQRFRRDTSNSDFGGVAFDRNLAPAVVELQPGLLAPTFRGDSLFYEPSDDLVRFHFLNGSTFDYRYGTSHLNGFWVQSVYTVWPGGQKVWLNEHGVLFVEKIYPQTPQVLIGDFPQSFPIGPGNGSQYIWRVHYPGFYIDLGCDGCGPYNAKPHWMPGSPNAPNEKGIDKTGGSIDKLDPNFRRVPRIIEIAR